MTNWTADVKIMLKACEKCQVSKIDRLKPQGMMNPVAQPLNIAQHYNIDFIGLLFVINTIQGNLLWK